MSRKYTKINQYEKEILQWKSEGMTKRENAQRLGLEYAQIHNWASRYNERQRKLKAGIPPRKKADQAKMQSQETLWQSKRIPSSG